MKEGKSYQLSLEVSKLVFRYRPMSYKECKVQIEECSKFRELFLHDWNDDISDDEETQLKLPSTSLLPEQ